jgi:ribosome-associated toxin RatA of RatAB toxin-antitoxin module
MAMDLVMGLHGRQQAAAGRINVRRLVCLLVVLAIFTSGVVGADSAATTRVEVTESGGIYRVTAAFAVLESPEEVMAVLTDYARIPKFMPDVQVSKVLSRSESAVLVEQEAVSRFMFFSKRIHLVLDVREEAGALRFSDRCGRSFASYEGAWLLSQHDSLTVVDYQLTAKPSFEVPGFVLKHLLKRDAGILIDRLKAEISLHAAAGAR